LPGFVTSPLVPFLKPLDLVKVFIDINVHGKRAFNSNWETKARPVQPHSASSFDMAQEPSFDMA
jgi:hypothetical protein